MVIKGWILVRITLGALILLAGIAPAAAGKGVLRIGVQGKLLSLDPHVHNETFSLGVLSNSFEGLVRRDQDLRLQPGLAERWQQITPLHWRFHLRRGVRFHDGSEFTATDVLFSYNRALQPHSQQRSRLPKGARFVEVDSHTVDVHLISPNPVLHADWENLLIMSASWAKSHGVAMAGAAWDPATALPANGTGPYVITYHRTGELTRFERNPHWWGRRAAPDAGFETVRMYAIGVAQTRTAALLSGQVDVIMPAPIQDLARFERTPGFRTETGPELRTIFLNMDQMRARLVVGQGTSIPNPLLDRRVRLAIDHAIDEATIARVIMRGRARPTASLVSPQVLPGVGAIKRRRFDPEFARELLRQAGYADGFDLPMDCPGDRYVKDREICEAIAHMLTTVGIRVALNVQMKSLFFAKVLSGGGYDSAFNLLGWTPGAIDGRNVLAHVAGCRDAAGNGARFNLGGYCNPEVDRLATEALIEPDAARREAMLTRAFQIIHDDVGFIPLHQQTLAWAMREEIEAVVRADNQIRFGLIRRRGRWQAHAPR
ncbi:MAG: ABC transporter substrate-binding protein [Alphaproteobacteria bacterium]|nr:ABC transporter substrate-binding protein [Alphaproteobacteria bacterium]